MTGPSENPLYRFDPWAAPSDLHLQNPVMVVALDGWVDAGMGASTAAAELRKLSPTTHVATFDSEPVIDQRARRPVARIEDGITTELTWPTIKLEAGKDKVGADLLYLTGPEPDFLWPTFIEAVVQLVRAFGVRIVIGLGAFPAPTPHTRPVRLASTVPPQSADLAGRIGTVQGTLEVPAGMQAALEVALGKAGIPIIGLWARVPHYVSAMPYPEASAALIDGLCSVTGVVVDTAALRSAGDATRRQIDELISANPDHLEMVRRLEAALDSQETTPMGLEGEVPSGDEIAAELERFLRNQGD
ncbi:MAG: proteasome assembly chaperone family protein [Acidimicrobiales bacterium]